MQGRPNQKDNQKDDPVLPENYLCERCFKPGHYIANCPTNDDEYFDQSNKHGIPLTELWRILVAHLMFADKRSQNL